MKTLLILAAVLLAAPAPAAPPFIPTPQDIKPVGGTPWTIDAYTGLGERRDAQQAKFAHDLLLEAQEHGGTVIVSFWTWHGRIQFHVMKQNSDGSWSGPIPSMGYHTSKRHDWPPVTYQPPQ